MLGIIDNLTNLVFFSAPGRSFTENFFDDPWTSYLAPLRTLELARCMSSVLFPIEAFKVCLREHLTTLRCVRVYSGLCRDEHFLRELDEVEDVLVQHAEEMGEVDLGEDEIGVVYFD